jgi:hypothetical protein
MRYKDGSRIEPKNPWVMVPLGCLGAVANLVVLWFIVLGLYGISTPDPNPPTWFVIGIPADIFFLFFFMTMAGALCLWLTFRQAGLKILGFIFVALYLGLVLHFARLTAIADAEHRETVNRLMQESREIAKALRDSYGTPQDRQ